ncbi:uncharacterized protein MELLADRAFT_70532 [Melampsora larici-populina 98AG31]|uniref:Alpha-type protein kinase domain-containing protein n=1 Tax=Melampsora larici-populina (strain 98AG31 / pathotype 3-4-7) TaxID=747676 RepID=F4R4M8_MELLP|nr:uncharacterized protein MELLADRAFT_70532 [Melampsora larici-populina 98AG31]EGG12971.1 hypothetical protein MELLADRAFT_70532 [Melampsora larici-populina 98AG31]
MADPIAAAANRPTTLAIEPEPIITLHSLCGFKNALFKGPRFIDTQNDFGYRSHRVDVPRLTTRGNNVIMFAITYDPSQHPMEWGFDQRSASIQITEEFIHGWDFRSTFKALLSRSGMQVPPGVRLFDYESRSLRTHLAIAQMNFHVAYQLARFCDNLIANLHPADATVEEWQVLKQLRLQENMVGQMHDPVTLPTAKGVVHTFNAKEHIPGRRKVYSLDTSFGPCVPSEQHHPLAASMRLVLNTFSHWTYDVSGEETFICGFQGVGPVVTEAVVHDKTWGSRIHSNLGGSAVRRFPEEHECCKFCVKA